MKLKISSQFDREKKARTANRRLAKKRVQWLIEHSASYQLFCYVNSLVLRNRQLRVAAKRCASFYGDSAKQTNSVKNETMNKIF